MSAVWIAEAVFLAAFCGLFFAGSLMASGEWVKTHDWADARMALTCGVLASLTFFGALALLGSLLS